MSYYEGEWLEQDDEEDEDADTLDMDAYYDAHDDEDTGAPVGCIVWGALITFSLGTAWAFAQLARMGGF